jgi:hypothetical protein
MKKVQGLCHLVLVFFLVFGIAGQSFANEETQTNVTEDGRVQLILEFNDTKETEWASQFIGKMKSKNIVSGYPDGTFRPNQPVKRVEAIVMAVRLMGLEEEAKAKSSIDTKLHFKDAQLLETKFPWAKGYVLVALENGLFDLSEEMIQPEKQASRIWVSSLLVKSLGLQKEALRQMTAVPDFKDANQIPAGAIGYINVAVEQGLVSGYPDQTFKPNKNVTRAEIAALLDRTNNGLLEQSGAMTVSGTVIDIQFGESTVTSDVYQSGDAADGTLTITTADEESFTYSISSKLLVQYHKRFIHANQLIAGDEVKLVVNNETVVEAAVEIELPKKNKDLLKDLTDLADKEVSVREFELKIEFGDEQELKLKYKKKNGKIEGEVEKKLDGSKEKAKGEEAAAIVEEFLDQLALSPDMSKEEIVESVLSALDVSQDSFKELEIQIKYSNGKEVEIELENEDEEDEENED